jgi:uncharacterized membrane protein YdjX (TVP38/TMEM64 family)
MFPFYAIIHHAYAAADNGRTQENSFVTFNRITTNHIITCKKKEPVMKQKLKIWIAPSIIIGAMLFIWLTGAANEIDFEQIKRASAWLTGYAEQKPLSATALFSLSYILAVSLSLPIASFLTLAGGFVFGLFKGTLIVVLSATLGATLIFVVAKSSAGTFLKEKASPLYRKIEKEMHEGALSYMLFMRLIPIFPFFLVNIVPALFNVKLRDYVLTTMIGIIPGTFVYVNIGKQLSEIERPDDLLSPQVIFAFCLLAVFALIPQIYKKLKKRKAHE